MMPFPMMADRHVAVSYEAALSASAPGDLGLLLLSASRTPAIFLEEVTCFKFLILAKTRTWPILSF